jgi:hypothetical protein
VYAIRKIASGMWQATYALPPSTYGRCQTTAFKASMRGSKQEKILQSKVMPVWRMFRDLEAQVL